MKTVRYSRFSECGHRDKLEDYMKIRCDESSYIYVLCDGIGGHDNGELVAEMIIDTFLNILNLYHLLGVYLYHAIRLNKRLIRFHHQGIT